MSTIDVHEEIEQIKRKLVQIDTAFLRDDLAAVDYPGHRIDHLDRRRSSSIMTEYKVSGTKVIIGLVITFLVGLLASGVVTRILEVVK